ncbi:hypothetical protein AUJ17_00320 [Candidatus Micrarchaeota archaeon CG1_02_47_40]|nr:MAG: hypothetical protein AUJ17_00320 [Candidatus Micrarchaeota archaeon CG1_02_47_40]
MKKEKSEKKESKALVDIGEAVGIVAAQSIGEPGTQMSLAYDEKVLVSDCGEVNAVKIGEFIDGMMERFGSSCEDGHEICKPKAEIMVPSLAKNEKVEWKQATLLSRHACKEKLLELSLRSGRKITATPFHSFVIRRDNLLVPVSGSSLKKGDRLPVLRNLACPPGIAVKAVDIVPALQMAMKHMSSSNGLVYAYPREGSKPLPRQLELDGEFGWLLGIYLAEGNSTHNFTSISNTDLTIQQKIRDFAKAHGLTTNEYDNPRGFSLSHDIRINSALLAEFLKAVCGTSSYSKRVPLFAYSANEKFISSLLRGYFDGDGNVSVERRVIRASSKSKELIDGICLLLARLGIFAGKRSDKKTHNISISYRYAPSFLQKIGSDVEGKRLKLEILSSSEQGIGYNLVDVIPGIGNSLLSAANKLGIPSRFVNNFTKRQKIGRSTLIKYLEEFERLSAEKNISLPELLPLKNAADGDVLWDEIEKIERVSSANNRVYDFTVPGAETFTTFDGVITHNTMRTFHYAGVAEQVPSGLPRLIEIVDARREPKEPLMDIFLKEPHCNEEKKAEKVAEEIESTVLSQIADIRENFKDKKIEIMLDEQEMKIRGIAVEDLKEPIKAQTAGGVEVRANKITVNPKISSLRAIRKVTTKLASLHIKGIEKISKAMVLKGKNGQYFIRTSGSNISTVMRHAKVIPEKVYSNDVKEIERFLGIEAARNSIVRELKQVLDLQRLNVDVRHLMLLADAMCMDGHIKSVGRHGLSGEKAGVLAKAAFEETIKHLISAASEGQYDNLIGVTENIIIGQTIPVGTGIVRLKMKKQ